MSCSGLAETQWLGGSKLPHLDSSQHCPKALKIAQHEIWHPIVQIPASCAWVSNGTKGDSQAEVLPLPLAPS